MYQTSLKAPAFRYGVAYIPSEEIHVRMTAKAMQNLLMPISFLPPSQQYCLLPHTKGKFAAVGSSYIINLCRIVELTEGQVIFEDGEILGLSRKRFTALIKEVKQYRNLSGKT